MNTVPLTNIKLVIEAPIIPEDMTNKNSTFLKLLPSPDIKTLKTVPAKWLHTTKLRILVSMILLSQYNSYYLGIELKAYWYSNLSYFSRHASFYGQL